MATKTASQLFQELKTEVEGARSAEVTSRLLKEIMDALGITHAQFAKATGVPWVTVKRWLGSSGEEPNCPRTKFLSRIEGLINKEVMPLSATEELLIYPEARLIARFSDAPKRSWTFMGSEVNDDQHMTDELLYNVDTERYYVFPVDDASPFRSFRRKIERGGFPQIGLNMGQLKGKIIGLAVDLNDYPLFVKGLTVYVLEFEEDDQRQIEGYMALPVMQRSGKSQVNPVVYVQIDEQLVRKWHKDCELLTAWYEAHKAEAKNIEELEVKYA